MEEAIVEEWRAAQLDLAARVPFTKAEEPIEESRTLVTDLLSEYKPPTPEESADKWTLAAQIGLIEVG